MRWAPKVGVRERKTSDTDADRAQKRFVLDTSQANAVAINAARMPPIRSPAKT
jgi:hypothetical protein